MKTTYRLYPVMRTDKQRTDKSYPIYFFLRVGGHTTKIPTGKNVMANEWNKKENTAKSNSQKGIALASFLNKKISDFNSFMLSEEAMGKEVSLNLALSFFDEAEKIDFYQFFENQIKMWENEKKYNTLKSYTSTLRILKLAFPKLSFADINYSFIEKFDYHLSAVRKNSTGGKFTKHKVLRCMINQAILKKLMKENPYKFFKFKPAKGNREYLNIEEVEKIMRYKLPSNNKNIYHAQKMFVFSCFTGLRFSDVINLKYTNIKSNPDRIEIIVEKTSKPLIIPLSSNAKSIINEYQKQCIVFEEKNIFPKIANGTINKELKKLMILVGINKHVSHHLARHTFATLHISLETSLSHLKELMGHKSILDTMIYAKTMEKDLFKSINHLDSVFKAVS